MSREYGNNNSPKILIVDDISLNVDILANMIEAMGYLPMKAQSGREALKLMGESLPQLILMDISMPEMNGYELCELLKGNKTTRDIPIIFISAMDGSDDKIRGFQVGAVDFITKPFELTEVTMRVENHLKIYKMQQEMEAYTYRLNRLVNEQSKRLETEQKNILIAIAMITEGKDERAQNHLSNVSYNSRILAQSLQFSPVFEKDITAAFIEKIGISAMLHDVGKIQISEDILLKPGPLTPEEKTIVRQHSEAGAHMLETIYKHAEKNDFLPLAINIARYHHEKWNGEGYPEKIKGKEIPICARIAAIVNVFDTLTGARCYKEALPVEESLEIIEKNRGVYFDPDIVDVFMKMWKQLKY